jgi:hypothetical protein
MKGIVGRLIILAAGVGLVMLGLTMFGNLDRGAPKLEDPRFFQYWREAHNNYYMSRWVELFKCIGLMFIGAYFSWVALTGSFATPLTMWFSSTNGKKWEKILTGMTHIDEFEAKKRGGQKCPHCGSYDTHYVETVGVDTAQFKCSRCGQYFLKDR